MSKFEVKSWKDTSLRNGVSKELHPCGQSMRELTISEIETIYGASEVSPRWLEGITAVTKNIGEIGKNSGRLCAGGGATAIAGLWSYNSDCLA
ncbi:mersacidin family lantibiotic [Bacillus cereus]|uniref:mersacidin family lantibiotic n=1 Tax=Bacillus cereus TaxID=1396 RepID=UPI001879937A|nr:mersacidin family lantibiotic [Bacillus cereus]MBE7099297.1 hypothetical protein [Bacillus cereus]